MKTKVICLVGASGTGKTYIAKQLADIENVNIIYSYITRPPRYEDEWGHTFISSVHPIRMDSDIGYLEHGLMFMDRTYKSDMIAYFNSYNSRHHYFATDEQVIRGKTNIYVVDPEGAEMVKEYYKKHNKQELAKQGMKYHKEYKRDDIEVITIAIHEDESIRHQRILERELQEMEGLKNEESILKECATKAIGNTKYRIDKDKEIFKVIKCDYSIKGSSNTLQFIKEKLL